MTPRPAGLLLLLCALALPGGGARAAETEVMLFGQKCKLQGPVEKAQLDRIHAIGPEQVPGPVSARDASSKTRASLDKIRKATVPAALDRYKDRQGRRLEAQLVLLESLEAARKSRKGTALLEVGKKNLKGKAVQEFEALVKKLEAKRFNDNGIAELVFEFYNERIEQDPAEDFHRALRSMGVKYACSYDEGLEGEEGEEEGDEPAPSKVAPPAAAPSPAASPKK